MILISKFTKHTLGRKWEFVKSDKFEPIKQFIPSAYIKGKIQHDKTFAATLPNQNRVTKVAKKRRRERERADDKNSEQTAG